LTAAGLQHLSCDRGELRLWAGAIAWLNRLLSGRGERDKQKKEKGQSSEAKNKGVHFRLRKCELILLPKDV
jgi:hypothetical protein